jgi:hypothetical protein
MSYFLLKGQIPKPKKKDKLYRGSHVEPVDGKKKKNNFEISYIRICGA